MDVISETVRGVRHRNKLLQSIAAKRLAQVNEQRTVNHTDTDCVRSVFPSLELARDKDCLTV